MNNTIPFHSATHASQITVDVNILTMLKQAASCLTEAAGKDVYLAAIGPDMELTIIMEEGTAKSFWKPIGRRSLCTRQRKLPLTKPDCRSCRRSRSWMRSSQSC